MTKNIYQKILNSKLANNKLLAILLDPDKCTGAHLTNIIQVLKKNSPDLIFVGGSHMTSSTETLIDILKANLKLDVVLFPGDALQFSNKADALLFLSLISGRNAEFLIGQHIGSAINIKKSGIEVIPTAYVLIEGGKTSSVEYISNTRPIPADKNDIAVSTAVAGELLGMKLIYLEAGSGAENTVPETMIQSVSQHINIPLIVGGGIKTVASLEKAFTAGADLVVVGNVFETEPNKIIDFVEFCSIFNQKK